MQGSFRHRPRQRLHSQTRTREGSKSLKDTLRNQSEVRLCRSRPRGNQSRCYRPIGTSSSRPSSKSTENIYTTVLPAQSDFEAFEEKLSDGNLRAESPNQVVSVAEQEEQESKKAEPQRHMSLHLDGQLSIQTKRRFVSTSPATPEQLRLKYKVLANCWLMGRKAPLL